MPLSTSFHTSGVPQFKPNDINDPLTRQLLNPRKNETEAERRTREREEREASKRSKDIDDWIEQERKTKKTSKIILLGQSQSGKSTTLKNLQLHFSPNAFEAERPRWKTVIQLNLVRSLRKIHEALTLYSATQTPSQASVRASPVIGNIHNSPSCALHGTLHANEDDPRIPAQHNWPKLSPQHHLLLLRLRPILSLERELLDALLPEAQSLYGDSVEFESRKDSTAWRNEQPDYTPHHSPPADTQSALRISPLDEICIPASLNPCGLTPNATLCDTLQSSPMHAWPSSCPRMNYNSTRASRSTLENPSMPQAGKVASLQKDMKQIRVQTGSIAKNSTNAHGTCSSQLSSRRETPGISYTWEDHTRSAKNKIARYNYSGFEPGGDVADRILAACTQDILSLWNDAFLRNLLCGPLAMGGLGLDLHEDAGFFLNDVERITSLSYLPTDDDIVRARLKTMGVSEHRFVVERPAGLHTFFGELIVYDVGGSRTQRHKWMPFFDDINAIVFLAPINQCLAEDPKINRLQDTFALWTDICQTPMLAKVDCLLFLNKCDLLHAKLKSGLVLKKFIPQYEGGNNLADAINYFQEIFMQIWRKHTDELRKSARAQRAIYIHSTCMIDIAASRTVIKNVQDCALRSHLRTTMVI